jgi:hypothetical protein
VYGVAKKELLLALKITAETTNASKAVQDLTQKLIDLERQGGKASRALTPGGGGGGIGSVVGVGQDMLGGAGRIAGGIATAGAVVQTVANLTVAIQGLSNPATSAREKMLGLAQSLPIVGDAIANLVSTSLDAIERLRDPATAMRADRERFERPIRMGVTAAEHAGRMRADPFAREAREAGFRADAVRRNPNAAVFGRVAGRMGGPMGMMLENLLAEDNPVGAGLGNIQNARRGLDAAQTAEAASGADVARARARADGAQAAFKAANAKLKAAEAAAGVGGGGHLTGVAGRALTTMGGVGGMLGARFGGGLVDPAAGRLAREVLAGDANEKAARAAQANAEYERAITEQKKAQLTTAQQQAALTKAETEMLRTKKDLLQQERDTVKGGLRQLGAMDETMQWATVGAFKRFQKGGRAAVTDDEMGLLQGNAITAEAVAKRLEEDFKKTGAGDALLKLAGKNDLKVIENELKNTNVNFDLKVQLDETELAKKMAEIFKSANLAEIIGVIIKREVEIAVARPGIAAAAARVERGG